MAPQHWIMVGMALLLLSLLAVVALVARAWRGLAPPSPDARCWRPTADLRWLGVIFLVLGPGMMVFMLALIPIQAHDLAPVLMLVVCFGWAAPLTGLFLLLARFRIDAAGLVAYSAWGRATFVPWSQITQLRLSGEALRFETTDRTIYVLLQLQGWPEFVDALEHHLGQARLPEELRAQHRLCRDGAGLAYESHWQGMYDYAGRICVAGALAFLLGILGTPSHWPALYWAIGAGFGMALFQLFWRLLRQPRRNRIVIGEILQGGSMLLSVLGMMHAYRLWAQALGGEDAVSNLEFLAINAQMLGCAVAVMGALLLLARLWKPQRFQRERMGAD